ncbi:hypothetical protein GCM10025795_20610 [Verticiella sediminum]
MTVLAVSIALALLGAAIGFGMIEPLESDPMSGVGTTFTVSSAITLIVSLAAGGFVAGRLAGTTGASHGFLVWATALLVSTVISAMALGGALRIAGNAVGTIFSAAGTVASGLGNAAAGAAGGAGDLISRATDEIGEQMGGDEDLSPGERLEQVLRDTGVRELQPSYLRGELAAARRDVRRAVSDLADRPDQYAEIAKRLGDQLGERADGIVDNVDREAAVNALQANTEMPRDEAERAVDQAIASYREAVETVQQRLSNVQEDLDRLGQRIEAAQQRAREEADRAAAAASRSALWGFIALLIGALVSAGAGLAGARSRVAEVETIAYR